MACADTPAAAEALVGAETLPCDAAAGGIWAAADTAGAAVPLSGAAPVAPEDELPVSAGVAAEVESGAGADDDESVGLEPPAAGAEPPALAPESVDGVAVGPDDAGADADVESVGAGADVAGVPGAGSTGGVVGDVTTGAVGSLDACGDEALVPPVGEPDVVPLLEAEPVAVDAAVDVEVAPLDVVGVEEAVDDGAATAVDVAGPGTRAGAPSGPASGLWEGPAARGGTEASSASRAVGGAVAG